MEYISLGHSGLKVSRLCLGTLTFGSLKWRDWVLDEADSRPIIKRALEMGINFFDTADKYSEGISEEVLGRALRDFARREEVVIATKVYTPTGDSPNERGLSRKHIMHAVDASLRRLGTDYIDLYQIHRWDYETPIEETLEALNDLIRAGKALYIGACDMYSWQFAQALYLADLNGWTRFVSMQSHYNLVYREEEREMLPLCRDQKIAGIPWGAIARGFLAGNRPKKGEGATKRAKGDQFAEDLYYSEADYAIVDRVLEVAQEIKVKPAQIALSWVLRNDQITAPLVGISKLSQLEDAVAALTIDLSAAQRTRLEELYRPHTVLGHA